MTHFEILVCLIFLLNFGFYWFNESIAKILNLFDTPDFKRKLHSKSVPITGGLYLFINIILISILSNLNLLHLPIFNFETNREFFSFIFLMTFVFLVGIYDDKFDMSPLSKLSFLMFIIFISVLIDETTIVQNLRFSINEYIIQLSKLSIPFTVLSILIFLNALNMFDGIDMQVSLYFLISLIFIIFKINSFYLLCLFPVIIFNIYLNFKKKLFMGDSGTNVISVLISWLIIKNYNLYNAFYCEEIFLLMLVPGLDMLRLFFIRIIKGKNPFYADNNHLHHLYIYRYSLNISIMLIQFQIFLPIFLYLLFDLNPLLINFISIAMYIFVIIHLKLKKI